MGVRAVGSHMTNYTVQVPEDMVACKTRQVCVHMGVSVCVSKIPNREREIAEKGL